MRYIGKFNSIDGRSYRIEIKTPGEGEQIIKLSGNPFVSSVKGDGKNIFAPIRCGGATVGILSDKYIFDLYSGQAKNVKVTLHEETVSGDVVRWTGYGSPTIYDQGHDEYFEEIYLDCVDGVAVLKDIPFRSEEKKIKTLLELISHCLKESGCFKSFYISDNVQLTADGTEPVIERFRISTSNFFDTRKDISQTDDDVAWSCYEVLEEIIRWLGYTITVKGEEVFILDYDAVDTGTYHRYSLEGDAAGKAEYVKSTYSKAIKGSDYAGTGARVSLDEIYNKVTVKDDFNTYDNLFPTFGDENYETNLTIKEDDNGDWLTYWVQPSLPDYNFKGSACVYLSFSDNWNDEHRDPEKQKVQVNIFRFMDSPVFNFHKYDVKTRQDISDNPLFSEGNFNFIYKDGDKALRTYDRFNGGVYIRLYSGIITRGQYEKWLEQTPPHGTPKEKYRALCNLLNIGEIPGAAMSPVILFYNEGENRFGPCDEEHYNSMTETEVYTRYPFMTLKGEQNSSIFGGKNHLLRIKGKVRYHAISDTPFPVETELKAPYYDGDKKYGSEGYIWCKVKWGSQWWDGDNNQWSDSECWFRLFFWDQNNTDYKWKNSDHYNKDFDICRNTAAVYPDMDGYVIPCPTAGNLEGYAEVAFTTRDMCGDSRRSHWGPKGTKFDNFYCRNFSTCVFLKNLSVTAEVSPGLLSDADLDSDTCYTNVIDNGSISEMSEISFKVCTDDGKKPSYSSVDFIEGSQSRFVTATYNRALMAKEIDTEGCDGLTGALRQEEHMVFKLASHYEAPRVVFDCNLHNEDFPPYAIFTNPSFGERRFILSEWETDYRFNSVNLKITEKE